MSVETGKLGAIALSISVLISVSAARGQQTTPEQPKTETSKPERLKPEDLMKKCRGIITDAAHDHNPDVRKNAAEALSLVGVRDLTLDLVGPLLDDKDVTVRIATIDTLADLKENRAFVMPLLRRALQDRVPEVEFAAAKVLYQLHDPLGTEFLLDVISKESKASSNYISKEKRSALRLLHTPTQLFMTLAIEAAGFAPVPGLGVGISSARGILADPESSARAASLLLVGNSAEPEIKEVVQTGLDDKEWSVRAASAHVVAVHPFPEFRSNLVPLLDDKKNAVEVRAAAAYIRLGNEHRGAATHRHAPVHHTGAPPTAAKPH